MEIKVTLDNVYTVSNNIVSRRIQDEFVIIPLISGRGDLEDTLYTLNESGEIIWNLLDGKRTLKQIVTEMSKDYDAPENIIETNVKRIIDELLRKKLIAEVQRNG